ncbi:MAG: site-specific DNA-methyltransferase [Actinomycetales bacterium]|nr:MAG: site-specific DNA-methyltransferase [Actinomycetales bacterium]
MNETEPETFEPAPFFETRNSSLYLGSCVEVMNSFPEQSVDMIFADPPYNLSNDGYTVHAGKRVSVNKGVWDKSEGTENDFIFHQSWIEACKRVLKENGTIWISGTYHSIYACGYALQLQDFRILNDISWYKPNAAPNLGCRMFTASHETILWASKSKKSKHVFNYSAMRQGDFPGDMIKNPGKQMRSVWSIITPSKNEKIHGKHPTQKPLKLLDRIVLASTNLGDVILDPFCGSSTTGVSAILNNRKFIGIDLDKEFLENLSVPRLVDAEKEMNLRLL